MATESEIQSLIESRRDGIQYEINYHEENLAKCRERLGKIEEEVRKQYQDRDDLVTALTAAGFTPETNTWGPGLDLTIEEKDLPRLTAVTGHLDEETMHKAPAGEGRKQVAKVSIKPARHTLLTVRFTRKLSKADKCRVVTVVTKRRELVCGM